VSGVRQKDTPIKKGTVMKKNYQTTTRRAGTGRTTPKKARPDAASNAQESAISLPETVTVALAELAGELEEGLLAFAVGTGLKVLDTLLEHDAVALAGAKGRHDPNRKSLRHGSDDGLVTLGGRQVQIRRPRVRSADKTAEIQLPTYQLASSTELLGRETLGRMLANLSTRHYVVGLEPMGKRVAAKTRSVSKSAVSRRFVAMTESALLELMSADLSELDLVAVMIDGANLGQHLCVVALGIALDGTKHPLAVVEGDTENATVVKRLLVGLRDRGLEVTKPTLFVIDGSTALPPAIKAVFDHPVIARCEEHKVRNVRRHLPKDVARIVERRMRSAYRNPDALAGQGDLEALAKELARSHPGAAASLREGLAETFTISRLGVPPTLARTLRSTNAIESMIDICKTHARNVKRWRDGTMALRWCAAGMVEAKKQFHRVQGYLQLRALRAALEATVTAGHYAATKEVAA
jgi:putative transposase